MRRGTTQRITFVLPEKMDIAALYITFSQKKKVVLEKELEDAEVDGMNIVLPLAQEDTLRLSAPMPVEIQLRIRDADGNAVASDIIRVEAKEILKEGVI